MMPSEQPTLFVSLGSPSERDRALSALASRLQKPAAILVVAADWCTRLPVLSRSCCAAATTEQSTFLDSPLAPRRAAHGNSALARRIKQLLKGAGIAAGIDAGRRPECGNLDVMHRLFPQPDVPLLQLSIQPDRCARHHHALGAAIASLRRENILIAGLGKMTPNLMDYEDSAGDVPALPIASFRDWAHARLVSSARDELFDWRRAGPGASLPVPEHFLPLFVVLGAAGANARAEWLGGSAAAADNYLFVSD